jgi:outer membrane protein TolC
MTPNASQITQRIVGRPEMRCGRLSPTVHLLFSLLLLAAAPATLAAGEPGQPPAENDDPILTLDEALSLASADNHVVRISTLETERIEEQVKVAKSRRLPQFQVEVLAGSLLQPFDFNFPKGSFGTYPGIGEIPATDSTITTEAQMTTLVTASVDQPLLQLYKINYGVKATELGREIAFEGLRVERHKVTAEVRSAYFDLVATQAALEAAREAVRTLGEAQRVTAQHEAEQSVLRGDALEVDARLAKSEYDLQAAEDRVATQREILNDLLGRDLATRFRVEPIPEQDAEGVTLEAARQRAAENRPEIRQARLKEQQADYERRIARADYIPDLSLSVRYTGFHNYEVLPTDVAVAGLFFKWDPFDWGRRHHTVEEKSRAVEQARHGAQQAASQVAIEAGRAHRGWSEAALLVKASRAARDAARERLREISHRYEREAALLKDLLEAQSRSAEAEFEYQNALSSYWSATAELRRAMGDE